MSRDANGVRRCDLHQFPQNRIIRHAPPGGRHDQVAITHLGVTTVYDTPQALCDALLTQHPEIRARVAEAGAVARRTIALERDAARDRAAAAAERAAAAVVAADARRRFRVAGAVLAAAVFVFFVAIGGLA